MDIRYGSIFLYNLTQNTFKFEFNLQVTTNISMLVFLLMALASSSRIMLEAEISLVKPELNVYRQMIVRKNLKIIQEHNSNPHKKFTMTAYPPFIALTPQEFKELYARGIPQDISSQRHSIHPPTRELKEELKRRAKSKVSAATAVDLSTANPTIYNQGICGNCYAFATVEGVNIYNSIWKPSTPKLSIQQVTDCSNNPNLAYRNNGCNGGVPVYVLWYIAVYGLVSQAAYPLNPTTYLTGQSQPCKAISPSQPRYRIQNWYSVSTVDCSNQILLLNYYYPVTTIMYSSTPIIMYYQSGIITGCPQVQIDQMDHAILIVGYNNTDPSNGYLKVKNSWGKGWGEGGYFRIAINGNQCGICYTSVSSF